jgi:hypothetical protein
MTRFLHKKTLFARFILYPHPWLEVLKRKVVTKSCDCYPTTRTNHLNQVYPIVEMKNKTELPLLLVSHSFLIRWFEHVSHFLLFSKIKKKQSIRNGVTVT